MLKRKTCAKCPDRRSCTKICKYMEEILKRDTASLKEKRFTDLKEKKGVKSMQGDDAYIKEEPDYLRDRSIDKKLPTNSVEFPEPRGIILNDNQMRIFRKHVDKAILSTHKKQKRWFYEYMRCKTSREISEIANCSAENVRKQIQKAVNNVLKIMSKETKNNDVNFSWTPKDFKDMIILSPY